LHHHIISIHALRAEGDSKNAQKQQTKLCTRTKTRLIYRQNAADRPAKSPTAGKKRAKTGANLPGKP
jgi:hypothetical protein